MAINLINRLIEEAAKQSPPFPPTDIFNETWLIRVVLDWFSNHRENTYPLGPMRGGVWYSEALLPSAFLARSRPNRQSEGYTHADGVIGHFKIGRGGKAYCSIEPDARQFVVCEAKVFSKLSPRVRNAPYFDQAARTVACIAEVLGRLPVPVRPQQLDRLAFLVLAPVEMINAGCFRPELSKESIERKVRQRVSEFGLARDAWLSERFLPLLERIDICEMSWETIITFIQMHDEEIGGQIKRFYDQVIRFNRAYESSENPCGQ